jgi:membrane protein DedA with SNARE-associated domain
MSHSFKRVAKGRTAGKTLLSFSFFVPGEEAGNINIVAVISETILDLISSTGYLGIFLAMLIEGVFTPIPSELIMPFAGYLTFTGTLNIVAVIIVGSLGAMCGSIIAYLLGRKLGRPLLDRYGRYFGIKAESLDKAEAWFARWGCYGILIGHAVPGIRSIISFPAGISRMELKQFALFTFLGATVWNTVLVSVGYVLGQYWMSFAESLEGWDIAILISGAALFVIYVALSRWRISARVGYRERTDEDGEI